MKSDYVEQSYGRITASNKVELLSKTSDNPSITLITFVKAEEMPKYAVRGFSKIICYTGRPNA